MIGKALRKQLLQSVQSLVFGKTLLRKEGSEFAKAGKVSEHLSGSNKGLLLHGKDLRLSEQVSFQNVAVYGIKGKEKSTAIARSAILDKAGSAAVMIVNNMSGDLYRDTSGYMKARGYRVVVLNGPLARSPRSRHHSFCLIRPTSLTAAVNLSPSPKPATNFPCLAGEPFLARQIGV